MTNPLNIPAIEVPRYTLVPQWFKILQDSPNKLAIWETAVMLAELNEDSLKGFFKTLAGNLHTLDEYILKCNEQTNSYSDMMRDMFNNEPVIAEYSDPTSIAYLQLQAIKELYGSAQTQLICQSLGYVDYARCLIRAMETFESFMPQGLRKEMQFQVAVNYAPQKFYWMSRYYNSAVQTLHISLRAHVGNVNPQFALHNNNLEDISQFVMDTGSEELLDKMLLPLTDKINALFEYMQQWHKFCELMVDMGLCTKEAGSQHLMSGILKEKPDGIKQSDSGETEKHSVH